MNETSRLESLAGDALLAQADELHARLATLVASGVPLTLDLSRIGAADVSFVQLMVSSSLTAGRAGQPLKLTGLPPKLRVLFEKAGVGIDPIGGHIMHN